MVITRHFVLVHVPKTGGTFLTDALLKLAPHGWGATVPQAHLSLKELGGTAAARLPVFCAVRSPWAWYVSWYHYRNQYHPETRAGSVWRSVFGNGRNDFATAVRVACTGEGLDAPIVTPIMERLGVDFFTARLLTLAGDLDDPRITFGLTEALRTDFVGFLDGLGLSSSAPALTTAIAEGPPLRTSVHGPYRDYYDAELRDLVGTRAAPIVERFGYRF